jgi:hypothetical protein
VLAGALLTAGVLAAPSSVGPTGVAQAAPVHECSSRLNTSTRKVYRFRIGGDVLDFARIEVTAQQRNRNAHCIRVRTDRQITVRWTGNFYVTRNGRCRADGETKHSPFTAPRTIRTGFRVATGRCIRWTYEIEHDGRWFAASVMRSHR